MGGSLVRHAVRRWVITLVAWLATTSVVAATPDGAPRIATLDWTIAETLIALDARLVGLAQIDGYAAWVGEPAVPTSVLDLGLRAQPNLEQLAGLAPDRLALSPMFAGLAPRLETIAPVTTFSLYGPDAETWPAIRRLTRELGAFADREREAEALIARSEAKIDQLAQRLPAGTPPLIVVQFMDSRHVRVFGENGLYHAVLERLGLENGWTGETNRWGFSLVGLESLARLDGRLVVVRPYPVGVARSLADSALWTRLSSRSHGEVIELDPVWSFGALPSATRFAEALVEALDAD
ncbi:iron-siderophore ABC transporter substrate-binding protein [Guyparkeria hydrothermalis]|uniref:iron-siderophore ABC transporter substrate-binding protein n=1 Tax=Guyparkeria hydrothermalis TaxID=923 RepID=UPI0020213362|nr:iron-siderophore ABC transporter substrate-binding protein [Guyparkeria hydrothermalis]MCL7744390.1 iron-siderophore ABC transporter substrate-binding protein [Guyparkeria hydrothermalis]